MCRNHLYTCIMFFDFNSFKQPIKYRNVINLERFKEFAFQKGAVYINVYDKRRKEFIKRIYIE